VPVWHEATETLRREGRVRTIGIVQEQHGDRARLFMQWQGMDWPVMVDAQNELGVAVVPITLLIDEHGVIQEIPRRRRIESVLEGFVGEGGGDRRASKHRTSKPDLNRLRAATVAGAPEAWSAYGGALVDFGGARRVDDAINALAAAIDQGAGDGLGRFQLGVAYRKRFDSPRRQPGDFARAAAMWSDALAINPNQYIWRRRIQQYGPRLDKPYPFYDWVPRARAEITARGETPVAITVEPSGAEFAQPSKVFVEAEAAAETAGGPDPDGRIARDDAGFITVETVAVPAVVKPGSAVRVHVIFRPATSAKAHWNKSANAHWNNEAEEMSLWVDPPEGWAVSRRGQTVPNAATAVSREDRAIEFELRVPADAPAGTVVVSAYTLYNVCEDADGVCLYRRKDLAIEITIESGASGR